MPIPNNPQTREEQYLNAMATGNTSGLPSAPQTRAEQYLDYIAKNGGGGGGGGGDSGIVVLHPTKVGNDIILDKTYSEIRSAMLSGKMVVRILEAQDESEEVGFSYVWSARFDTSTELYSVEGINPEPGIYDPFVCESPDEYPKYESGK